MLVKKRHKKLSNEKDFDFNEAAETASEFILAMLSAGSILISGSIQPALLTLHKRKKYSKKYSGDQLRNAYYNLKRRKLIEIIHENDGKIKVKLTNKGKERIREFSFEMLKIKKPSKWDKKWRILIFDIPTKPKIYNHARDALRKKIKELDFYQMQKSVWIYPYECEDEILLIAELYQVQKHIEIITAEKILHEGLIKRHFGL